MSKETREFDIAIVDFCLGEITITTRVLPKDITTEELEEILTAEGRYKESECSLMFKPTIHGGVIVKDNRK